MCVYVLRVRFCVRHICIYIIYIYIRIYIYSFSFIHTLYFFSFLSKIILFSLLLLSFCIFFFFFFFFLYEYIYSRTVVGNGWTESLSMKILLFLLISSSSSIEPVTRYPVSFPFLLLFLVFLIFWSRLSFLPLSRGLHRNNATGLSSSAGKLFLFVHQCTHIGSQKLWANGSVILPLTRCNFYKFVSFLT